MDAGTTHPAASTASTIGTQTVPEKRKDISADFDTFLSLLTAQLRSQDPLNPVNSTDFIAQLASFSTVEQQTRTNELLADFVAGFDAAGGLSGYVSWIGQEVAAQVPAQFDGSTPIEFQAVNIDSGSSASLTIRNDFGTAVAELVPGAANGEYIWDGRTSGGELAPAGTYSAEFTVTGPGGKPTTQPAAVYAAVREVRMEAGAARIVLQGGATIAPEGALAVRTPSSDASAS